MGDQEPHRSIKELLRVFLREGVLKCYRTDLAVKRGRGPKNY